MRWIISVMLLGMMMSSAAADDDLPIAVYKTPIGNGGQAWDVVLTSHAERLDIRHISLNRGSCHATMDGHGGYPNPIHFGQQIVMRMFDCDPIEVRVETDQGNAIMEMDK